jgi:hypothetical protein
MAAASAAETQKRRKRIGEFMALGEVVGRSVFAAGGWFSGFQVEDEVRLVLEASDNDSPGRTSQLGVWA